MVKSLSEKAACLVTMMGYEQRGDSWIWKFDSPYFTDKVVGVELKQTARLGVPPILKDWDPFHRMESAQILVAFLEGAGKLLEFIGALRSRVVVDALANTKTS